jgi:hypothetical protein
VRGRAVRPATVDPALGTRSDYEARKEEIIEAYLVLRQTYSTICIDMLVDRSLQK